MRLVFDGKSLAVGVFAGAALVAGMGAAQNGGGQAGRFRIGVAATNNSPYAFVLDTVTGQVWRETDKAFSTPKPLANE